MDAVLEHRLKQMDYLFNPKSIAFIGATEKPNKWGFIILRNLYMGAYKGKLYPVNPGRDVVLDLKAYPSVRDIPGEVDMAVFTIPAAHVMGALDDCIAKGVKAGVIISAGFKELGGEAVDMEAEIVRKARAAGMVLVGPNGMGVCCPKSDLYSWMCHYFPRPGSVAVVSQSGNIKELEIHGVIKSGFGLSKSVSSGNEADLRSEDYFEYLADDPDTKVILSYIEGITDGRRFLDKARETSKKKPIVLLKGARTESGSRAASSHTGAMAMSDKLFEAACRQAGIVRVNNITEAGAVASSFINRPLPKGKRVGIVTGGGGLGVVAADLCTELGLEVPRLSEKTLSEIGKLMPAWWVPGNPVDMVAGMNFEKVMVPLFNTLMRCGEIDALMILFFGAPGDKVSPWEARNNSIPEWLKIRREREKEKKKNEPDINRFSFFITLLARAMNDLDLPVYLVANYDEWDHEGDDGIPTEMPMTVFPNIETACMALSAMADYNHFLKGVSHD